jgi:hypothetical protein
MINWDIYEIRTEEQIHGVMMRGRLRKLSLNSNKILLTENAVDANNIVRVAVYHNENVDFVNEYLKKILSEFKFVKVLENVPNPVLSKLKVNIESRYTL